MRAHVITPDGARRCAPGILDGRRRRGKNSAATVPVPGCVAPPKVDDPRITYVESLSQMIALGRYKPAGKTGEIMKKAPASFNLRSATRTLRDFSKAVCYQRLRAATGFSGHCTPNITHEGDVLAGESRFCWKIGTVKSTNAELTKAVLDMGSCNRCGLESGLGQEHKRAIGLSSLYMPGE